MSKIEHLHLFEGYGIEIEYMLVDLQTLKAAPVSDRILTILNGSLTNEVELGEIAWSNELVMHVIELKTNGPKKDLLGVSETFHREVAKLNDIIQPLGVCLMPGAMHPLFHPDTETKLWPHDNAVIYKTYNDIFSCKGHGWSNLQSIHINMPFGNDEEFGRLHAAIRLVLPLLPSLAASSPIVEGKVTGLFDNRLEFYRQNQKRIPSITGHVIPERVFSIQDYHDKLLARLYQDIAPFDPDEVLKDDWLNSRGAIARFERNAIEIRVLDSQESVRADFAVISAVVATVQAIVEERWLSYEDQKRFHEEELARYFLDGMRSSEDAAPYDREYLAAFGFAGRNAGPREVWAHIAEELGKSPILAPFEKELGLLIEQGPLARRILKAVGKSPTRERISATYRKLCECLQENRLFQP